MVPACALAAVALWQMATVSCIGRDVPGDEDWQRAAAHVREHRAQGELIVFAPEWLDPVGRLHLGDEISVDMAARMDAATYPAIWELSARGARAPETADLAPASETRFGELRVRRYEQDPPEVVTDFRDAFQGARVEGSFATRPELVLEEVGFSPRRCVRAQPRPGGEVRVIFSDVKLGERLVGYAGLADIFTLRDIRDPGHLRVVIEGEEVAARQLDIDDGWQRFEVQTEPRTGVEVRVVASAQVPDRLICFAAEART